MSEQATMAQSTSSVQGASVDTKRVTGRRTVRYDSFDEVLADAERLAIVRTRTLGNWSLGQSLKHLAMSMDMMIDGSNFMMPAPSRFIMRLLMKRKMLAETLSPGFKLPKKTQHMIPGPTSPEEGLQLLRAAVQRVKTTDTRAPHPAFGKMIKEEWDEFQLRHCELHMSFVVPVDGSV